MLHDHHTFDPTSGWCTGCGARRDDGRAIGGLSGRVLFRGNTPEPETPADERFELVAPS